MVWLSCIIIFLIDHVGIKTLLIITFNILIGNLENITSFLQETIEYSRCLFELYILGINVHKKNIYILLSLILKTIIIILRRSTKNIYIFSNMEYSW